jgi:Flp pilus assembly protein TadG
LDSKPRRGRAGQRGQVVVEFVLASAIAFTLMFGVIDFGRALYAYDAVASAASVGSRYAIVHGSACTVTGCPATSATIKAYVLSQMTGVTASSLVVTTTWSAAPGCTVSPYQGPLCLVKVEVQYPFKFVLSFGRTVTMTAYSEMIISQ